MVVGEIGGGTRWFGWMQNKEWLQKSGMAAESGMDAELGRGGLYGWKGK